MRKWPLLFFQCFLPAKIRTSSLPVADTASRPLVSHSIEFTPEIVNNVPNSQSPGPDGWPIPLIKSLSEFTGVFQFHYLLYLTSHSTLEAYLMTGKMPR